MVSVTYGVPVVIAINIDEAPIIGFRQDPGPLS
jgi:hypothetical protein